MSVKILHNPRCSKSRATLALLQDRGIDPEIILYLEQPPTATELTRILSQLGRDAQSILRKGEPEYRELGLHQKNPSEEELVRMMVAHPKLIERPIVLANQRAAIGRPPESVLEIL